MMLPFDDALDAPSRVIAWFSCGAASAVAAKYAIRDYGTRCIVVYCDTMASEHIDNARFFEDIQSWLGQPIVKIKSKRFTTIDEVFDKTAYMSGIRGARCTGELKRLPRFEFQRQNDLHVFGLTSDEAKRAKLFEERNHDLDLDLILIRLGLSKTDCFAEIKRAGIPLPVMYELGYQNNNCIGCVKATSKEYWMKIRHDFPDHFKRRAEQSRRLGVRLTRINGERVFLDELPQHYEQLTIEESISCGPDCGEQALAEQERG